MDMLQPQVLSIIEASKIPRSRWQLEIAVQQDIIASLPS
jgi:hypothetical protein